MRSQLAISPLGPRQGRRPEKPLNSEGASDVTNTLHFFQIKGKDGRFKDSGQEALVTRGQGQQDKLLSRSCHRKAVRFPKASEGIEVVGGWDRSVGSTSRE